MVLPSRVSVNGPDDGSASVLSHTRPDVLQRNVSSSPSLRSRSFFLRERPIDFFAGQETPFDGDEGPVVLLVKSRPSRAVEDDFVAIGISLG